MSRFLHRLGSAAARHPWRVIAVWLLAVLTLVGLRGQFGGSPVDDFRVPGIEAQRAADLLAARFPSQTGARSQVVFHVDEGRLTDAQPASAVEAVRDALARNANTVAVTDPLDRRSGALSADGRTAYATVFMDVKYPSRADHDDAVAAAQLGRDRGVQVELTSPLATAGMKVEGRELLGLSIAVVVLLVAFGSLIAMAIPIGTAIFGLVMGTTLVGLLAGFVKVPSVAPLIATMIGLGVGIDYALFVVTRHRGFLAQGAEPAQAAGLANATAGQAVLFAGGTVVVSLCGLALAGIPAVTIMGMSAGVMVAVAVVAALTLLPAFLGLAGRHIDRFGLRHRVSGEASERNLSARWAARVGRRPWRYGLASLVVLLLLAAPALALRTAFNDDTTAPSGTTERKASELLARAFGPGFVGPLMIVTDLSGTPAAQRTTAVASVHAALAADPGIAVAAAPVVNQQGDTAVITAIAKTSPQDAATARLVHHLRDTTLPAAVAGTGVVAYVASSTAALIDVSERVMDRLPVFIAAVVAVSFLLLMVVFRSVLVPLKAAVMNLLSIAAAYGVVVAVFQWGWGAGLIGLHDTVPINPFVPMMMFAILFGLSMDYEVFLLSRIREEYVRTGDSHASVVSGLAVTARVITSAALIMISVFLAFVTSPEPIVKMYSIGMATAVLVDATIVRLVLVPATMALLGRANWWLPRWLDRLLPHLDLEPDELAVLGVRIPESPAELVPDVPPAGAHADEHHVG